MNQIDNLTEVFYLLELLQIESLNCCDQVKITDHLQPFQQIYQCGLTWGGAEYVLLQKYSF